MAIHIVTNYPIDLDATPFINKYPVFMGINSAHACFGVLKTVRIQILKLEKTQIMVYSLLRIYKRHEVVR